MVRPKKVGRPGPVSPEQIAARMRRFRNDVPLARKSEKAQAKAPSPKQAAPGVTCPACGNRVREGARFCGGCGAAIPAQRPGACPGCGAAVKEGAKFCGGCGHRLG